MTQTMRRIPLIGTQLGIWLADQVAPSRNAYAIAHAIELAGAVDAERLSQAIRTGLAEADTVTARFGADEAGAYQMISQDRAASRVPAPERLDFTGSSDPEAAARAFMADDLAQNLPADGERPLCRQVLMNLSDARGPRWFWYQRYHHVMLDGFSFTALTRRVAEIYSALNAGQTPAPTPFTDVDAVIAEEQAYVASPACMADRDFWLNACQALPASHAPLGGHGPTDIGREAGVIAHAHRLPVETLGTLEAMASERRLAVFDLILAAVAGYLHRLTGESRQVVGVPFMRRMGSAALTAVAPVVNVLPVRLDVDGSQSLAELGGHVKAALRQVRRHQRYDAERIQRDLGLVGSGRALYGPVVNYRMFDYDLNFGSVRGITHHLATGPVDDIEFGLLIHEGIITFELRAHAGRHGMHDLELHGRRLERLLEAACRDPSTPLARLPVMDETEASFIGANASGPMVATPDGLTTILDVFAAQAHATPDATALVHGPARLCFAALSARVFRLARLLVDQGVGPEEVVAVGLPRSPEAVVAMLAVMASGAAYLPLDLDYPAERLATMCADARPRVALTLSAYVSLLPPGPAAICLDDTAVLATCAALPSSPLAPHELRAPLTASTLAYVIFTSGSTGRPKGVMNTHGALLNLLTAHHPTIYMPGMERCAAIHPGRRVRAAHTHSFAFDSSWLQIFWMLLGQELHVIDEEMRRDADALVGYVRTRGIDAMDLSPSFCAQMLHCGLLAEGQHHPSVLLIGGEAASPALWTALRAHPELIAHNLYGPTEYTVDTLHAPLRMAARPVIGRPIGNTHVRVLDRHLQPVPLGAVGELYIAGHGRARGYWGQPGLTAQRFVADPFRSGEVMYRTGDLVRWTHEGLVEFIGRSDHQVKVRGYRVETAEIEAALEAQPGVDDALVVSEAVNDSHRLIAYCAMSDVAVPQAEAAARMLRHALKELLPDYMIPAAIVVLEAFPLTVNGKVDRARLPAPTVTVEVAPASREEACLCAAMARVLRLPAVGAEADFFAHGGDSITAIMLCTALRADGFTLRPRDVFALRDPRRMALALAPLATTPAALQPVAEIPPEERAALETRYGAIADMLPVLPTQKGMLFHAQLGDGASSYNAFTRLDLEGRLDVPRLRRALDAVLRRHPQLAGVFDAEGRDEPLLLVPQLAETGTPLWPFETHDLSTLDGPAQATALARLEEAIAIRPQSGAQFRRLIRAVLVRLGPERHILVLQVHHLLIDGWSSPLLLRDLMSAYRQDVPRLAPLRPGYGQVVRQLAARDLEPSRGVWREALEGIVPCLMFEAASAAMEEATLALPADITEALLARARQRGITLNVLMQAVWGAVLGSMAGREEVVFGMPVSGRSAAVDGIGMQVGLFLNTVPVRLSLNPSETLWDQMAALQARHAMLMEHDGLGLGEIQALAGGGPLFDTLLVVENYPDSDYLGHDLGGIAVRDVKNRGYSHYPLALLVLPGPALTLLVENRGAVADAEGLAQRVGGVLEALVRQPDIKVADLPMATVADRAVTDAANATEHPLPALTLRDLIAAQAARTPDAIALVDAETTLTFRETRRQVLQLAQRLREAGVRTGDVVAVALPRSARLSLALLAVIEAGAAFLPLDLSYPTDRLTFMLADAAPRTLIADGETKALASESLKVCLFETLAPAGSEVEGRPADDGLAPDHPAYVLYTSGTTGRPKGVVVPHGAIVNRLLWMQHQYPLDGSDVILQKTPCGFDVSVWEFFWSHMVGARLVMAPPDAHRDPLALVELIETHKVTTAHFVPSMLAIFLATLKEATAPEAACRSLRRVFCSGEALGKDLARSFASVLGTELHNLYGPTEAAVDVTYAPAGENSDGAGGVPIGRPVWNTELLILDHLLRPVAVGVPGELYLGGVQLAAGYLGRPDLSATRFVAHPFKPGARLYRTGDVARWRPDGQVDYLGRTDYQIKIRGQRVELGEIEAQIARLPGIARAVVQAVRLGVEDNQASHVQGADERQLVAYVVPAPGVAPDLDAMASALKAVLPAHMVPALFVPLDALPLSANGKLDRKALPLPASPRAGGIAGRPPAEGLEARIAAIFADLTGRPAVGAQEDFFAIGGHSLLAMRLAARIRQDLKRQVSVGQIVVMPTVEKLAAHLLAGDLVGGMARNSMAQGDGGGFDPIIRLRDGEGPPLVCIYPASGVSWQYSVLSRYLRPGMPILGLQSPRPHGPIAMSGSMEEMWERQLAILREAQPHGPYYLLGYSLGGTVAYGLAVKLRQMGEEVPFLGLLDTYPSEDHDWSDPDGEQANLGAEREQEQFINDAMADVMDDEFRREKEEMFGHIFDNYRDSVSLLSKARTPRYDGHMTLFAAGRTLLPGLDPERCWTGRVGRLSIHRLPHCSHEDIVSPASLEILGPLLNALITEAEGRTPQAPSAPALHQAVG